MNPFNRGSEMLEQLRKCVAIAPFGNVVQKLSKQLSLRVLAGLPADSICHSGGNHYKFDLKLGCDYFMYVARTSVDQPSRPVISRANSNGLMNAATIGILLNFAHTSDQKKKPDLLPVRLFQHNGRIEITWVTGS